MKPLKASDITELYSPSDTDKKNIVKKVGALKLSGDGVFHTIQGEGDTLGLPATFIRLHFCNLKCSWCDTWYTWHTKTRAFYTEPFDVKIEDLHQLIQKAQNEKGVQKPVYRIVFTGGEPLLQQNDIVNFLELNPKYICEIETNGTIAPSEKLNTLAQKGRVKFNCSPKLENSKNNLDSAIKEDVLKSLSIYPDTLFKFVCKTNEDIEYILKFFRDIISYDQIAIMPEGVTKEENSAVYENIIDTIIRHNLRTYPRLQNICFDGAKRGV